jgi:hypothetical protein
MLHAAREGARRAVSWCRGCLARVLNFPVVFVQETPRAACLDLSLMASRNVGEGKGQGFPDPLLSWVAGSGISYHMGR